MGKPAEVAHSLHHSLTHLLWERNPFPAKPLFPVWPHCPAFRVDCVALKQTALSLGSLHNMPKFLFELEKLSLDSYVDGKGCVVPRAFHATYPNNIWATGCKQHAGGGRVPLSLRSRRRCFSSLVIPQELNLPSSFSSFMTAVARSVSLSRHSASGHRQTHSYCHIAVSSSPPPFVVGYLALSLSYPIPSSGESGANKSNFPSRLGPR